MKNFVFAIAVVLGLAVVAERSEACNYPTFSYSYGVCAPAPVTTYTQTQYRVVQKPVTVIKEYIEPVQVEVVAPQTVQTQTYAQAEPCAPVQAYATNSFVNLATAPYYANTYATGYGYNNTRFFRGNYNYGYAGHVTANRFFGGGFYGNIGVQKIARGQVISRTVTRSRTVERVR